MEALISAAASIQNCTFNGQARRFLTARHGRRVRFPARHLYYEADGMWLTALKLARELGDRKSELEILYLWGRLQHVPPSESTCSPAPFRPGNSPASSTRNRRGEKQKSLMAILRPSSPFPNSLYDFIGRRCP